jgi:phosphoribosylaminoimidazolecarboxamide formyltransferase / IMP cyclohydrolase
MADRVAAFGGCIALNREVDLETARLIAENYAEVVGARVRAPASWTSSPPRRTCASCASTTWRAWHEFAAQRVVDFKSLIDGGLVAQWSFVPEARRAGAHARRVHAQGARSTRIRALPTARSTRTCSSAGWSRRASPATPCSTSRTACTVGIGTGEQDRVGVAEIARDKAYRKLADRICWEKHHTPYNELAMKFGDEGEAHAAIDEEVKAQGRPAGLLHGLRRLLPLPRRRRGRHPRRRHAVVQPGGAIRDWE